MYTHIPVMRTFIQHLQSQDYRVCAVYLLDAQFLGGRLAAARPPGADGRPLSLLDDPSKFCSGVLSAMSVMVNLEVPHLNVLTKMDLVTNADRKRDLERCARRGGAWREPRGR